MRETCLFCATKHIAQATVLLGEVMLGYPMHLHIAVGHLAEAEHETIAEYPEFSEQIREVRLVLMGQDTETILQPDIMMQLITKARRLAEPGNGEPEEIRISRIMHNFNPQVHRPVVPQAKIPHFEKYGNPPELKGIMHYGPAR